MQSSLGKSRMFSSSLGGFSFGKASLKQVMQTQNEDGTSIETIQESAEQMITD